MNRTQNPGLAFFAAQFSALMIGSDTPEGVPINNLDDVCRFAADSGITGIDLPLGMLDVNKMLADEGYREEQVERFRALGTPIIRLSSHTDGQLGGGISSAYLDRVGQFASQPERMLGFVRNKVEAAAMIRIQDSLRLGQLLGTTMHQTFHGGRGVPHHDQWPTLPELFRQYAILHLALKWTPTFEVAHETGQRLCFEIGHVMEGIQDVDDMLLFRSYLPEHLRYLAKWGVDTSHMDKEGDDAVGQVESAIAADLDAPGHAKSAVFDPELKRRRRQNARPFAEQGGYFSTFGTTSPDSARAFVKVLQLDHERQEAGSWAVIEGEDMTGLKNPFQGMRIASENLRRIINGQNPIPLHQIEFLPWYGPTFETFAKSSITTSSLLELGGDELADLWEAADRVGLPRPN
jgi:sugar phosphate isomerase/epimerase